MRANYEGSTATVKKDRWGFTLANFRRQIPFGTESFAFPMHVQQVFFIDAREDPGWKIVLRKEVRGQRMCQDDGPVEDNGMFAVGDDAEHEGLRAPEVIPEENDTPLRTGRTINSEQVAAHWVGAAPLPDLDLRKSGASSEKE